MRVAGYGLTNVGLKRQENEDFFISDSELGLFLVCDGIGGHAAGEIASRTAAILIRQNLIDHQEIIQACVKDSSTSNLHLLTQLIEESVHLACERIFEMSEEDPTRNGMGTTLAMVLFAGGRAIVSHVGDSRVYLMRQGQVHQLTEDHTIVAEQLKKGLLTKEQAERSLYAHIITRSVGHERIVQVDSLHLELAPGDRFLLCSDGLSDYFFGDELANQTCKTPAKELPKKLIDFALGKGGKDNVTAVIVEVEGEVHSSVASELMKKIDILHQIPLFRYLTYKELVKLVGIANQQIARTGEIIIKEGGRGDEMFIILSGAAKVMKSRQQLAVLKQGSFFGEMQLIDNVPRSATVIATEASKLLVLSRKDFFPLLRSETQMAVKIFWEFCQVLDARLRSLNELFVGSISKQGDGPSTLPFVTDKTQPSI